jgi:hypothetical protein
MKRLLAGLAIAVAVGVVAVPVAWDVVMTIALTPRCESTVLSEQKSPNGAFVFWVFRRNCGATTGYATSLSIRRAGDEFDPEARDEVFIMEGDVSMSASWVDVDRIEVDIPKGAEIFRSEQEWNGVTIRYVAP